MAIGRTSNHGSADRVQAVPRPDQSPSRAAGSSGASSNSDIAIYNFKMGCNEVMDDLKKFNQKKTRDIEHCFFKLTDNIPKEIINAPINYCLNYYAEFCYENENKEASESASNTETASNAVPVSTAAAAKKDENLVIDDSVCDNKEAKGLMFKWMLFFKDFYIFWV